MHYASPFEKMKKWKNEKMQKAFYKIYSETRSADSVR